MRSCPCFHLILNKIPLNKTKNASDVWPRWNSRQMSTSSKWRAEKSLDTTAKYSKHSVENNTSVTTPNNTFEITNLTSAQNHFTWHRHWKFGRCFKWSVRFEFKIIQKLFFARQYSRLSLNFFWLNTNCVNVWKTSRFYLSFNASVSLSAMFDEWWNHPNEQQAEFDLWAGRSGASFPCHCQSLWYDLPWATPGTISICDIFYWCIINI